MLTLFTCPKPFHGHIGVIQRNAIRSWTLLRGTEIILFGEDEGTAEAALEFGTRHVRQVERNEYGTPLLHDIFRQAQSLASHELLCYVNGDIILMDDFVRAIELVNSIRRRFLMVGQRWDVDVDQDLSFTAGWQDRLQARVKTEGKLHDKAGIDYFAFRSNLYQDVPPFAIGRTVWDNWLISRAIVLRAAVVDATEAITVVHQNHGYVHNILAQGLWKGPERDVNFRLAGGWDHIFNLRHADWLLTPEGLRRPNWGRENLMHRLDNLRVRRPYLGPATKLARRILAPITFVRSVQGAVIARRLSR